VRRLLGQAALWFAWLCHHLVQFALGVLILCIVAVGALALRLSQGPLEIPWIAHRLEADATADGPTRLTIGRAELAWEGWRLGLDRPLDLRLTDIAATDANGTRLASLPRAELSVSAGWLLLGRIVPRALEMDGARLRVARAADGAVTFDLGSLTGTADDAAANEAATDDAKAASSPGGGGLSAILHELTNPARGDSDSALRSRWAQVRRIRIRDAAIAVIDHQLGATWRAPHLDIDLTRRFRGGVTGEGHADLSIGGQTLGLTLHAALSADDAATTTVEANLTPFVPARFASISPLLAPLAALDASVTVSASAALGPDLLPTGAGVRVHLDAGHATINRSAIAFLGADIDARIGGGRFEATLARLDLAPRADAPPSRLTGAVTARREAGNLAVAIDVGLDQVAVADLPSIWPEGVGGPGTRPWIVANVTAGTLRDAKFSVALRVPPDLSDADLTAISGGFNGHDVTVSWLRPVPPIEHAEARLAFAGPDVIDITLQSGRQAGGAQGGIQIKGGRVHLTGIAGHDQFADIDADLAGPLPDLLAVLRHPRIRLLDRRPIEMRNPAGRLTGHLTVAHLPLKDSLSMDDLQIHALTHLTDVHLGGIAAGRDLDRGMLDLEAGNDGLHVKGTAQLAAIPSQLTVDMDFRDGPPSEVLTKVTVAGTADEKALAALGADPSGILTGPVGVQASLQERRDGRGDVAVHLDLTGAAILQSRLRLTKATGAAASGDVQIVLDHDRLASIARLSLVGDGILVQGSADVSGGRPNVLRLQRVKLGATTDLHGEIGLPRNAGGGYRIDLAGPTIDLSGELGRTSAKPRAKPESEEAAGPPLLVDLKFDRIVVAHGLSLAGVAAHVEHDGRIIRRARITGQAGAAPFSLTVEPAGNGRTLAAEAGDIGTLLRGLDVLDDVGGGRMSVTGAYDDRVRGHPLSGRLDIAAFRLRGAQVLGKILQGMTLYGLVDAMSGPGLNFTRLITPFRYTGDTLELIDARAFSSSLGMTAKGRLDLGQRIMTIEGTVVPAYFFNSLLGDIPLVGRIFSPEQGGGLFAVTYSVKGPFDDPTVRANPLSALTPGFLRGIFGVFDTPGK
jgi:hypothetical protein